MKPTNKVSVKVIQQQLESIVEEMSEIMLSAACDHTLNPSEERFTALFDGEGRLIAQAEQTPLHVEALPFPAKYNADFFEEDVNPGDVYLLNNLHYRGYELPILIVFAPVFASDIEKPAFWALARLHLSDSSGAASGAWERVAIMNDGLRIGPLKICDAGELRDELPDISGDLRAMLDSTQVGEQGLQRLIAQCDVETLQDAVDIILDHSDCQTQTCINEWEDGVYTEESFLDAPDGAGSILLRAIVTKKAGGIHVDLTECGPQVAGIGNSSYLNTVSALHRALASLIDPRAPKNEGTFRAISLTTKPRTIAHPIEPAPVSLSMGLASQAICDLVSKALSFAVSNTGHGCGVTGAKLVAGKIDSGSGDIARQRYSGNEKSSSDSPQSG